MFQISGNLDDSIVGLENYQLFFNTVLDVRAYFAKHVGYDRMESIDLYVDNATKDSGHTPIITPICGKYLIIKLHIRSSDKRDKIAYQFAHELMHFIFFIKYGLSKEKAGEREESICSAASLIVLQNLYPEYFEIYNEYVKGIEDECYRKGAQVAKDVKYDFDELLKLV